MNKKTETPEECAKRHGTTVAEIEADVKEALMRLANEQIQSFKNGNPLSFVRAVLGGEEGKCHD